MAKALTRSSLSNVMIRTSHTSLHYDNPDAYVYIRGPGASVEPWIPNFFPHNVSALQNSVDQTRRLDTHFDSIGYGDTHGIQPWVEQVAAYQGTGVTANAGEKFDITGLVEPRSFRTKIADFNVPTGVTLNLTSEFNTAFTIRSRYYEADPGTVFIFAQSFNIPPDTWTWSTWELETTHNIDESYEVDATGPMVPGLLGLDESLAAYDWTPVGLPETLENPDGTLEVQIYLNVTT